MNFDLITLFPEMFQALSYGITGRAQEKGLIQLHYYNPRQYTDDVHHTVDDRPYGGGPGMVMKFDPLHQALQDAKSHAKGSFRTIYLTPQGKPLTQALVKELSKHSHLILLAGRYEGIDQRLIEAEVDEEYSIGDYVVSGGELPAMVLIDAITRWLPDALGDPESAQQDSFTTHLLDHPHYTRPEEIAGRRVPEVLISGNHEAIRRWRLKQALQNTWQKRPNLLKNAPLDHEQETLLDQIIDEEVTA
ncbi:MAG TPA: tRNA (guanosine(37)-N1)-methyltransferase TrmD [Coxiellaceae bacterium]|nr:tRNA (guanosine(37)-N1)-methyltransferase TrmD [Coxiellaceae bacterium]